MFAQDVDDLVEREGVVDELNMRIERTAVGVLIHILELDIALVYGGREQSTTKEIEDVRKRGRVEFGFEDDACALRISSENKNGICIAEGHGVFNLRVQIQRAFSWQHTSLGEHTLGMVPVAHARLGLFSVGDAIAIGIDGEGIEFAAVFIPHAIAIGVFVTVEQSISVGVGIIGVCFPGIDQAVLV